MSQKVCFVLLIIAQAIQIQTRKKFPSYIELCHKSDPNISACVLAQALKIQSRLKFGVPELLIPPMNPLRVRQAGVDTGSLKATLNNLEFYHIDEFDINYLFIDVTKRFYLEYFVTRKEMRLKSNYIIAGKILDIPLGRTQGVLQMNFTDLTSKIKAEGGGFYKKGKQYIKVKNFEFLSNYGRPNVYFDGIFDDDRELNDKVNKVMNANIDIFTRIFSPLLNEALYNVQHAMIDRFFSRYPVDELFPN